MIFVTGDCHQDYSKFNTSNFPVQKNLCKDDYVIICGDFGGIWDMDCKNKNEKHWMDWLEKKSFSILYCDGNHENFDRLYRYPIKEWHGGKVHKIRPNVIHLMRGQIFNIGGKAIFTFGGARSHDISGGILDTRDADFHDKKRELDRNGRSYRIKHLTWWEQELASEEEMKEGLANLEKHDYKVDYIISHCCSTTLQNILSNKGIYKPDAQTDYLDIIREKCIYDKWYFGHYHDNCNPTSKDVLLYDQLIPLGDNAKESRPGHPRYMMGDLVHFTWKGNDNNEMKLEGRVSIVDAYGTSGQNEEPSYDIRAEINSEKCLLKHIRESDIWFE